jgi:hypothetical protein
MRRATVPVHTLPDRIGAAGWAIVLGMVFNTFTLVIASAALAVSGLSWRATHTQAQEAKRSQLLLEDQVHEQSKPDLRLEFGVIPQQGWIPVDLWCSVAFESATLTVPNEYLNKRTGSSRTGTQSRGGQTPGSPLHSRTVFVTPEGYRRRGSLRRQGLARPF